jgi:hypothetical protein
MTKAGDSTCRRAIVESLVGIDSFNQAAKTLKKGDSTPSAAVESEALKCNIRNVERYRHLRSRGKLPNIAKVAVASLLVRDMWFIGLMVKGELEQRS